MSEEYHDIFGETSVAGGYASVRPARRRSDGKIVARKQIRYSALKYASEKEFREKVEKEVTLMQRLEHPNIVQYYDSREVSSTQFNIYMELCEGKNLEDYVTENKTFELTYRVVLAKMGWPSQQQVWSVVYQLSAAIAYCHFGLYRLQSGATAIEKTDKLGLLRSQVLHRDVKPSNGGFEIDIPIHSLDSAIVLTFLVLLRPSNADRLIVKLCDFGLGVSRYPEDVNEMSFGGTRGYIAPVHYFEASNGTLLNVGQEITRDHPKWSTKADVFSLGCTFYYLMMYELPWQYQLTNSSFLPAPTLPSRYDPALKELIMRCIEKLPENRPEADEMFQSAFEHVNKADIILASLRTSDTTSALNQQISLPTLTAASIGDLSKAPQSSKSLLLDPPSRPFSVPADPSLPVVNNDAIRPPEPSQANPLGLPDRLSPWRQSTASGSFDYELKRGLGSFMVDFHRHPPLDVLSPPVDFPVKHLVHNLSGRIAFKYSENQDDSTQKRSKLKFYRLSRPQQTKSQMVIEAEASFQHVLENSEDYVRGVFDTEKDHRQWLLRKYDEEQDCYVVMGYITYIDARISEDGANENLKRNMAAAMTIEPGASSSSFNSRKTANEFEKMGENIQAVHVRKIILRGRLEAQLLYPEIYFDRLGEAFTWYFWGPKRRPIG